MISVLLFAAVEAAAAVVLKVGASPGWPVWQAALVARASMAPARVAKAKAAVAREEFMNNYWRMSG
ncbi:hypothetical protein GmRootV213_51970 (plasmid) [Variovorax sp. V213]